MEVTIYSLNGCKYCVLAEELMQRVKVDYQKVIVNQDISSEDFKDQYDNGTNSFPQIYIDGKNYGGLVEAIRHFQSLGKL